ncbi:MAG: chemotaxis protein CheA [Terracidiphilus sp.]|nr:chemotaxis protein CheA [Terracidiphilus sp.]MDR3797262.1 chemotaxis protein CheA [Terracidiphilus sp.]
MAQPLVPSNAEQFKQSFREEAREILTELESALLALNENPNDSELVSRIFRGLHTIKGSGSMFGFEKLASFTHNLETAFDEVRTGRLEISAELIDLTLAALDQIRALLEEGAAGAAPVDPAACAAILSSVRKLAGIEERDDAAKKGAAKKDAAKKNQPAPVAVAAAAGAGAVENWHIRFVPGPDLMRCGANPSLLLQELRQLGELSARAILDAVPPLSEIDPERCYIWWEIDLATGAGREAIRDVFIFVEDACELSIAAAGDPAPAAQNSPASDAEKTARALEDGRSASPGRRSYDKPEPASSLRVPAAKLDQFVDLVGELVTVQARLSELSSQRDDAEVTAVSEEVERLTSALRESSMNIRMMPIRSTFEKFRRLVHDLARDLEKNVELTIEGADTELDKTVIEQLGDPLMHLIRNSMDHGIEPADVRAASGKLLTATIHLAARHSGASVLVTVTDDGRGIDADAVRRRAIERGLISVETQLTESQVFALLFEPGFSTAKQVTDVSGRGVGMDVVRQRVESLRGAVEVQSQPGQGTSVTLRLPLTMAIIDGLLVGVGDACFVLPLSITLECIELTRQDIARANGKHIANVRGELVPYIRLREHFRVRSRAPEIEQIMLVETGEGRFGFVVDQVLGNCQTVIKSLGRFYRQVQVVSGATILGNGTVALILDPERLIQDAMREETRGRGGRMLTAQGGPPENSVDFRALAGRGSAGPSASAQV